MCIKIGVRLSLSTNIASRFEKKGGEDGARFQKIKGREKTFSPRKKNVWYFISWIIFVIFFCKGNSLHVFFFLLQSRHFYFHDSSIASVRMNWHQYSFFFSSSFYHTPNVASQGMLANSLLLIAFFLPFAPLLVLSNWNSSFRCRLLFRPPPQQSKRMYISRFCEKLVSRGRVGGGDEPISAGRLNTFSRNRPPLRGFGLWLFFICFCFNSAPWLIWAGKRGSHSNAINAETEAMPTKPETLLMR